MAQSKYTNVLRPHILINERYDIMMKRVLLTGMSGTGKLTLIQELSKHGYKAVDVDTDEWSE
jgi:predicted ATPase